MEKEEEKTSPFYSRPEKIPFFLLLLLPVVGSIPLSFLYALSRDLTSAATRSRYMRSRLPPEKKVNGRPIWNRWTNENKTSVNTALADIFWFMNNKKVANYVSINIENCLLGQQHLSHLNL